MKTRKEILNMTAKELAELKWSDDLDVVEGKGNTGCSVCHRCDGCTGCTDCYQCRNAKGLRYAICNVEVGKEAYEKKMKELGIH